MNVDLKISPRNLLNWENMEDWESGASAAPTEHVLSGAGASVARESTIIKQGTYSAAVTRAGADTTLYHDFVDYADYDGKTVTFGCWVYATVASRARISINDGVGSSNSSYHSGAAGWEFLTVTRNVDSSATQIRCGMEVNTGNTTAYFDGGILVEGEILFLDTSTHFESFSISRKYRSSSFMAPRRDGIIVPNVRLGEKTLSIKGGIWGTTQANARESFDSLLQYLNNGKKDIYLYDDRLVRAWLNSQSHDYIAATRVIKFDLRFTIPEPYNYFVQKLRKSQTISSSPTSFTLTPNGNTFMLPVIQFIAGGSNITSCLLENLTTGEIMEYDGTVSAGTTLKIDCDSLEVENNGTDDIANFSGDFLRLAPGDNLFKFTGSNCTIKIDWFDQWL